MNSNTDTSATYSSAKKITADETITSGEFTSATADENAISVSGNVTANLSNISVTKTGDSDGGDNTSFYVTNTTATINLENNQITNNDTTGNFLRIQKGSWGKSGNNGGTVTLNLTNQQAKGDIVVDSISSLTMSLKNSSSFTDAINSDNTGEVNLTLDASSSLTLTADTYLTSLTNADSTNSNIHLNGHKLYVNGVELTK